ncbi:MAG: hypothetical protein DHS20C12_01920 [Pseudohongiella sp.]|nr:MAG: hypothetical protein DHS20C12_01920 [Pseudohongiella sp.]
MKKLNLAVTRDFATATALLYALCLYLQPLHAAEGDIFGEWVGPGADAVLSIVPDSESAKIILAGMLDPAVLDENNPLPELRQRALSGITIAEGFRFSQGQWRDGSLYDPESGKHYSARLRLIDNDHLLVRGFIGLSLLGRSQIWTRLEFFAPRMKKLLAGAEGSSHDK